MKYIRSICLLVLALTAAACSSGESTRRPPPSPTGGSGGGAGPGGPGGTGGAGDEGGAAPRPSDAAADAAAGTGGVGGAAPADASAESAPLTPPGPTDLTAFKYARAVKMNTAAGGANVAGNVDNFPVAVVLDASSFDFSQAKDHGEDVRFAKADGTLLPYAIESWDRAAQAAAIWVKVDRVLGNNDAQSFQMHWGSAGALDAGDSKAVFDTKDSGFVGVWHLDEEGNSEPLGYKDASANEAHATGVLMAPGSRVAGRVGKGTLLQNSKADPKEQWIKVDSEKRTSLNTTPGAITVSLWALARSFPARSTIGGYETIISKGDTSWTLQRRGENNDWECCTRVPAYHSCAISKTKTALDTWFHFAIVFANPTQTLYINGLKDATATDQGWLMGDHPLGLGQQTQSLNGKRNWDGILDEARVANVARSADWIKLDFESQKQGQKFLTFGPIQPR
jgi:hypothetical protein